MIDSEETTHTGYGDPSFAASDELRDDVLTGLSMRPRILPSRLLYDATGTALFERIMRLPSYYLTRAEHAVLARHGGDIADAIGRGPLAVVDLGAGDATKTATLLEALAEDDRDLAYVPVDLSPGALASASRRIARTLAGITIRPERADYFVGLSRLVASEPDRRRLVLFLGSNVGNFERHEAHAFFRRLRVTLAPGDHVLVGFDGVKDPAVLQRAYDDPLGLTAAFNLNLITRINRELGADFEPTRFRHHAIYAPVDARMESYLLSLQAQTVSVAGWCFDLDAYEGIRTEVSCKYRPADIEEFAADAGFEEVASFDDGEHAFIDALWRVPDEGPRWA